MSADRRSHERRQGQARRTGATQRASSSAGRRPPASPQRPEPARAAAAPTGGVSPPRRRRPWYRRRVALLLILPALLVLLGAAAVFSYLYTSVPLPESIGQTATVVLDVNGEEIGTMEAQASRRDVPLAALPDHVSGAVLAAEDSDFYEHVGVSFPGIVRAAVVNVTSGRVSQGGSTISQQYVKNVTTDDDRTLLRKVREAALAVKLEREFTKDEILEYYLNTIYFGRGAYGVQAAAEAFYGKDAADLTVPEAAQLAGVIPAPSAYDPADNPQAAERRYRYVLQRMADTGRLDAAEARGYGGERPDTTEKRPLRFSAAPFFLSYVEKELARVLDEEQIYRGLTVTTSLDLRAQALAEEAYAEGFADIGPTGALVSIDNATGGIRALVGGKDFSADQVNMAEARRQPGSTFKAFALAAWVADGKSPKSRFDAPGEMAFDLEPEPWTVRNFGDRDFGELDLAEASWRSVNTVYAQVALEVGPQRIVQMAQRAGIDVDLKPDPSIVLGTGEVTPIELTESFATFASGGVHREPRAVLEVRAAERTLYRANTEGEQAFDADVAWTVTDVLKGVLTDGTGTAASIGRPAAGKTGTTQGFGDAWFVGSTPQLTTTVWMGNRDNRERMEGDPTGGGLPAQTWAAFMTAVHEGLPVEDFPAPSGDLEVVGGAEPDDAPRCPAGQVPVEGATDDAPVCEPVAAPAPAPVEEPAPAPAPEPAPEPVDEPEPTATPTPTAAPSPTQTPVPAAPTEEDDAPPPAEEDEGADGAQAVEGAGGAAQRGGAAAGAGASGIDDAAAPQTAG